MRVRVVLMSMVMAAALALSAALGTAAARKATAHTHGTAPGAPGARPDWAPADKHGFGTSTTLASKVWFTLEGGSLSEIYYPRLDTPSLRDLQFVVTDGRGFVEPERGATVQQTILLDARSLLTGRSTPTHAVAGG